MNTQDVQQLTSIIESLRVQLWVMTGAGGFIMVTLIYMAKTMWEDHKLLLNKTVDRVNGHDVIFGQILEKHDISDAIIKSGDNISKSINENAQRALNTLASITPPRIR